MAVRPMWQGHLKLSLVTCRPVAPHFVFDAEITGQPRRGVALDLVAQGPDGLASGSGPLGFGRLAEPSLVLSGLELAAHAVPGSVRGSTRPVRLG